MNSESLNFSKIDSFNHNKTIGMLKVPELRHLINPRENIMIHASIITNTIIIMASSINFTAIKILLELRRAHKVTDHLGITNLT